MIWYRTPYHHILLPAFAAVADTLQQEEYLAIGITGKNIAEHLPDTHLQSVIIAGDKTYEIVKVRRTMAQSRQRYIQTMREKACCLSCCALCSIPKL